MSEAIRIAAKLAEKVIEQYASNQIPVDPAGFRNTYSDLDDCGKVAVANELASRGLLHPINARRRKAMTATEILNDVFACVKAAYEKWSRPRNDGSFDDCEFSKQAKR